MSKRIRNVMALTRSGAPLPEVVPHLLPHHVLQSIGDARDGQRRGELEAVNLCFFVTMFRLLFVIHGMQRNQPRGKQKQRMRMLLV